MKQKTRASQGRAVPKGNSWGVTAMLMLAAVVVLGLVARTVLQQSWKPDVASAEGVTTDSQSKGGGGSPVFTDVTAESGLTFKHINGARGAFGLPELMGSGAAFFDFDNDGDLDVYLVQGGAMPGGDPASRNQLFENDGAGKFRNVSEGSGADVPGYGMGCSAADYDADGDVDLFVTRLGTSVLLRNEGGRSFVDVTALSGVRVEGFSSGSAFLDFDRDGLLDIFVLRYVDWTPQKERTCFARSGVRDYCGPLEYKSPGAAALFRNTGSGRFDDVSTASGIGLKRGNGLGVLATDFDGDGWVDIYAANDQTPAFLWMNQRDGTFLELASHWNCAFSSDGVAIAGMGTASEDFDGDGDFDLLVTNIRNQPHLCLRNDQNMFDDVSRALGLGAWSLPVTGFGVAIFDQDHDGVQDGYFANGAVNLPGAPRNARSPFSERSQFVRRDANGRFVDRTDTVGEVMATPRVSRTVIAGDYDNDGDLDLLVTNNDDSPQLLRNDQNSGHSWLMIELRASADGASVLNAKVQVIAGGRSFVRELRSHCGYLGSHDARVHFGLRAATVVEKLTVTWPDQSRETWTQVPVNKHIRLRREASPTVEPM